METKQELRQFNTEGNQEMLKNYFPQQFIAIINLYAPNKRDTNTESQTPQKVKEKQIFPYWIGQEDINKGREGLKTVNNST